MAEIKKLKSRTYTDINMLFGVHPATRDILIKTDEEAIKTSLKNLINTDYYERLFHPEIGCQIKGMLFEPFTPITRQIMRTTIEDTITNFEPRVILANVEVLSDMDNIGITVKLEYFIRNIDQPKPFTLTTFLKRVR